MSDLAREAEDAEFWLEVACMAVGECPDDVEAGLERVEAMLAGSIAAWVSEQIEAHGSFSVPDIMGRTLGVGFDE